MKTYLLISGATGGLGSAFVLDCAKRGYDILLTDYRSEGEDYARFIRDTFQVNALFRRCDLTSFQSRTELFDSLKSEGFRFWGLINVAGTDYEGAFLDKTREQVLDLLRLNVESAVDTSHNLLKMRDAQRRFMLINVCSLAAYYPMPYKAIYAATKRFLLDFTLAIGEEIRDFGSATALCPAGLPTTPEVMRAIFAQGFWGQISTMDTHVVAHRTIDKALKGKPVYIPGFVPLMIHYFGSFVPASLAVKFVGKRWQSAQNRPYEWHFSPHGEAAQITQN